MSFWDRADFDQKYVEGAEPIRVIVTREDSWSEHEGRPVRVRVKTGQLIEGWIGRQGTSGSGAPTVVFVSCIAIAIGF